MEPAGTTLRLYGTASTAEPLDWAWVEEQLSGAGTYWVVARGGRYPHPRPVWGVWLDAACHLSLGSPRLNAALHADPAVTVHLDSGTDVVVVEGSARFGPTSAGALAAYDAKYDWTYDVREYGELLAVRPRTVLAWRSGGWAGRDGFRHTGRWKFDLGEDVEDRGAAPLNE